METRETFLFVARSMAVTPGPSFTITLRAPPSAKVRVSDRMLLITAVRLIIVVLLTMTVRGRIGSWNRCDSTKTNKDGASTTPCGASGAHPQYPPPKRHETQAGAHSMPGTQTQP